MIFQKAINIDLSKNKKIQDLEDRISILEEILSLVCERLSIQISPEDLQKISNKLLCEQG